MSQVQPKDMSRSTEAPAELTATNGSVLKFSPINPVKVCGAMGRHVKSQRQDSFLQGLKRNGITDPKVIASGLAEIESQPYTMDAMVEEMQTYDGTRFVLHHSLQRCHPAMTMSQVEELVPDMVAALNIIMGISGISITDEEDDAENPMDAEGQTQPTGAT